MGRQQRQEAGGGGERREPPPCQGTRTTATTTWRCRGRREARGTGGERTAEGTKATGRGRHWPYHTQNGPKMTSIVVWAPGKFFLVRFLFFSFRLTLFFIYYRFYLCITTTYDPPSTITATSPSRSMSRRATARTAAAARDCLPGGNKEQRDGTTMPRDRDREGDEQQ